MEIMQEQYAMELKQLAKRKPILDAHILLLQEKVAMLEQEIDEMVIEKISHLSEETLLSQMSQGVEK